MELLPAIDLRNGKCVRLFKGDYGQETVFSDDPAAVAARWASEGAKMIHVVDLDGAREGAPANLTVVGDIVLSAKVPVQLGGGIRTSEAAGRALALGVDRVLLGTTAVREPQTIGEICREHGPEALVVTVDARDGNVATEGWTQASETRAIDLVEQMMRLGVIRFLYTDIDRDGTLTEPNYRAIQELIDQTGVCLIAAGGIASVAHILKLADLGVEAAVVGKALYTGDIDLAAALGALASRGKIDK